MTDFAAFADFELLLAAEPPLIRPTEADRMLAREVLRSLAECQGHDDR